MSEQDMGERHQKVADFVRGLEAEGKGNKLFSVGATSRQMAGVLNLSEATARKYLREAVAAGALVEVKHEHRLLDFPWPEGVEFKPKRWAQGSMNRGWFHMTEERQVGPAMTRITFVFTPERLKQVVDEAMEVDSEKALEQAFRRVQQERRRTEETAEKEKVFAKHHPMLAELLGVLRKRVQGPDSSVPAVRVSAKEHPQAGFIGRVHIEVPEERFAELETILLNGLGKGARDE